MRSGASINFDGNVVVMGDINPGAEVIATGNIIVTGSIRGMVHAGSKGNDTAIITGMGINPTQIRIANLIAVSDKQKTNAVYETAFVKDNAIYIE
jgi:septum site-determining protein MinC